jgi:hypothetical protein
MSVIDISARAESAFAKAPAGKLAAGASAGIPAISRICCAVFARPALTLEKNDDT